jgi:hypothetical protein
VTESTDEGASAAALTSEVPLTRTGKLEHESWQMGEKSEEGCWKSYIGWISCPVGQELIELIDSISLRFGELQCLGQT